jgi:hypothetical protein
MSDKVPYSSAFNPAKVYLVKGSTMAALAKAVNSWNNLTVQRGLTKGEATLVRGETSSVLTLPKSGTSSSTTSVATPYFTPSSSWTQATLPQLKRR